MSKTSETKKTNRPLEPGDRVNVYGYGVPSGSWENKATVTERKSDTVLIVNFDETGGPLPVHPKQCRRLKPRPPKPPKREPRRVWITESDLRNVESELTQCEMCAVSTAKYVHTDIEFIEVLPSDNAKRSARK